MKFPASLSLVLPLLFAISAPPPCVGYNILGIFPTMSKSHHMCGSALMRGLAAAGHNVSVVSAFPLAKPPANYRNVNVLGIVEHIQEAFPINLFQWRDSNPLLIPWAMHSLGAEITNYTLSHPVMRSLLADRTEHFDAIIVEMFLNDAMIGLGHHFGAPVIAYSTFGASKWTNDLIGNPAPLSFVPHVYLDFTDRMSFGQRIANTLMTAYENWSHQWHVERQAELYQRLLPGDDKPPLERLRRNVALVLLNTHFTLSTPRPYMPNMIEVGGIHIDRTADWPLKIRQLPAELAAFVDGAEHGVIYFSMGSQVKAVDLPTVKRDAVLRALGRLKQRVLWKWEDAVLPGKPDNVMTSAWFPQDTLLAHPKVRLFITHGGLLSTTEAVYHGMPLVGIPVFAEQGLNMARAEAGGYAKTVPYDQLTEETLVAAVQEVLGDERYATAAATVSARYRDQPLTPTQTAVYWVEYVARHGGAPHMHSAGVELSAIEYHMADVWALFALVVGSVVLLPLWLVVVSVRWVLGGGSKVAKVAKKKTKRS